MKRKRRYFVYIVRCNDGTYYTGYTDDVSRRVTAHNSKKGASYTAGRTPVTVVYSQEFPSRSAAMKREYEIKHRYTRAMKESLF